MTVAPGEPRYALLGWPLSGSLSPVLHAAAFRAAGLPGRYDLRPTGPGELSAAFAAIRAGEMAGANVTVPHKLAARDLLDAETELVAATGAVNTVVRTSDGLLGDNTDVVGFRHALAVAGIEAGAGREAVVLGGGGAARAVAYVLAGLGFRVTVRARSVAGASVVVGAIHRAVPGATLASAGLASAELPDAVRHAHLLVQCTPVGSDPQREASLWPVGARMPASLTVIDLVTWPPVTAFLRAARASGARAFTGLEMLLAQAAASWRLWTGVAAPTAAMREALARAIESQGDTG